MTNKSGALYKGEERTNRPLGDTMASDRWFMGDRVILEFTLRIGSWNGRKGFLLCMFA